MFRLFYRLELLGYLILMLLAGCGGGGSDSGNSASNSMGSMRISLEWPIQREPITPQSIRVELRSGTRVMTQQVVNKPAAQERVTVTFESLPTHSLTFTAEAFSLSDGKGSSLGSVSKRFEVRTRQQTNIDLTVKVQNQRTQVDRIDVCIPLATSIRMNEQVLYFASAVDNSDEPVFSTLNWSSSNSGIATVDRTGKVTGQSLGSCLITATEPTSGKQTSLLITVSSTASDMNIYPNDPQLTVGNKAILSAAARNNAGEQLPADIAWQTGNPGIALVSSDGVVTGVAPGNTRIIATDRLSGKQAAVTVSVSQPVQGGGRIVFYSDRTGNAEIYMIHANGSGLRQLTNDHGADTDPIFNSDGSKIAFVSDRSGRESVMLMGGNEGTAEFIVQNGARNIDPSFSYDGTQLAYASDAAGNYEIYVLDLTTRSSRRLTSNAAVDRHPSFSPDGRHIVFVSERNGNADIYLMSADGSGVTRLTTDSYLDGYPIFNPTGNKIAFMTNREGEHVAIKTYTMNLDGSNQQRVVPVSHCTRMPTYSPDGRFFAFAANPERNFDIYISNIDGTGFTPLFVGPGKEMHPSWGP